MSAPVDEVESTRRLVEKLADDIDERFLSNPHAYLAFQRVGDVNYDVDRTS